MMKSDEKYQVPVWMRPLLPLLCNTGGNDPEELLNDTETGKDNVCLILLYFSYQWFR